jgi:predicted TIM-barrel fold metal-dependent hydrolase
VNYKKQTDGLEKLKHKYEELIYPFIFVDPRRLTDEDDSAALKGAPFSDYVKEKIADTTFAGIKIYPALGYWPFCKDMKEVFNFAVENNIPLLSHCSGGPVYYRGRKKDKNHPIYSDIKLEGCLNSTFTRHYSNPLNYHMLMDKTILQKYWGEDTPDYSKLKICLGHFGGLDDWMNYLQNPWLAPVSLTENPDSFPALDEANWCFKRRRKVGGYTWFSIICSLITKYENIYTDISSTLHDERTYPLLKVLLETDEKLRKRILFGTDFYMVSLARSEKEFSIGLRGYLGEELFHQIAYKNVESFLSSKFSP